jgi:hypothetical protein
MKVTRALIVGAVCFGLLVVPIFGQVPVIFHATQTAAPGDIIGLQGGNFGAAPQVWMQHVIGTEPSLSPQVQLPLVNGSISNNYIASQIPLTETNGLYAIWVENGTNWSAPVFINQARAWGANDLAGTQIDPNRSFRLFGRNLCFAGATPSVSFVNGATTLPATVNTNGSDANVLHVTAPAGLVAGTNYTINVQNGFGGTYGQTALSYTLTGRAGGADPFGVAVPWGADFTFYTNVYNVKTDKRLTTNAMGDGTNDDTAAVQGAINAANAAGGGVVYLPTGTYLGKSALTLKSKVVLKGDGPALSQWKCQSSSLMSGSTLSQEGISDAGLLNICIYNTATGYGYNSRADNSSNIFILNSTLQTDVGKNMFWNRDTRLVLENSTFITTQTNAALGPFGQPVYTQACDDEIFHGNTVSLYFYREYMDYSTRALIENNHITRNVFGTNSSTESGGVTIGQSDSLVLLNNTFDKGGAGPIAWNYNDGETIMCQGGGAPPQILYAYGAVSSATSTTLTDATQSWTNNYSLPVSSTQDHSYYVAITAGPGLGQLRRVVSNTTTTITVDSPWAILPTSASEYAINAYGANHVLIKGNNLSGNPRGLEYYKTSTEDLSIINNTLTDNGAIWLWTNWQPPAVAVQMDTEVVGNYVSKSTNLYSINYAGSMTKIFVQTSAGANDPASKVFGMEFRHNTVKPMSPNIATGFGGEGFAAESDAVNSASIGMLGVIFQDNLAINTDTAYCVSTGDFGTTLWDNTVSNANTFLLDYECSGTTLASSSTVNNQPAMTMASFANGQFWLTWRADVILQSTTNLANPVWNVEDLISPLTVTPAATGNKFFRTVTLVGTPPPSPWVTTDVGTVAAAGSTLYTNGVFTQTCSGADIWGTADACQFCYQPSSGDCSISALVAPMGQNYSTSKIGVMIRETLAAGAAEMATVARPNNGTSSMEYNYRSSTGAYSNSQNPGSFSGPFWVRLNRVGNVFTSYCSTDGIAWAQIGSSQTINMASIAYIGIASTSHEDGTYAHFIVSNVSVTP